LREGVGGTLFLNFYCKGIGFDKKFRKKWEPNTDLFFLWSRPCVWQKEKDTPKISNKNTKFAT